MKLRSLKLLRLLLIPLVLVLGACVKQDSVVPNQTLMYNLSSAGWTTSSAGRQYATLLNVSPITNSFNQSGGVLLYLSFDGGYTWEQVPEVYNGIAYSYTHSVGTIEIDIQASNGTSAITPPGAVMAKVVLIPSSY
jgi:hypothetical protein